MPTKRRRTGRVRLDQFLVDQGRYPSRARARDAVLRGTVHVEGRPAFKPSQMVPSGALIEIVDEGQPYVSRAALKLKHGLAQFGIDVAGRHALDIGASAGGFTQVLLEQRATSVHAIDVGHGQLATKLAKDERVVSIEGLNARDLSPDDLSNPIDLIVCDVSFISLKLALPPALSLAESGANLVALVKPQFELNRSKLGKGGVVRDEELRRAVCVDIVDWLQNTQNWPVIGLEPSPITGTDGNQEFLVAARKP